MSNTYVVERSTSIDAPSATVFTLINSLKEWTRWSPWEGLDPELQRTYTGPEAGVGATYAWSGNRKAGQGTMTITESEPGDTVAIDLRFMKPFTSQSTTRFDLVASSETTTTVTWTMTGTKNTLMKLMSPVFNIDKMVGRDFERGLSQLRQVAESAKPT